MKQRKALVLAAIATLTVAGNAWALDYFAGMFKAPMDQRKLKFSTCVWTRSNDYDMKPVKGKPGPNDHMGVRYSKYFFEIDKDISVGSMYLGGDSTMFIKNHKVKIKRGIELRIATWKGQETRFMLENANVEFGGTFRYGIFDRSRMAGNATIYLDDSTLTIKGALNCMIEAGHTKNPNVAVIGVNLKGKSLLTVNTVLIDSIFRDLPSEWLFKWTFSDKGGNLPKVVVKRDSLGPDGESVMKSCAVEINLDSPKAGKYVLMDFAKKKGGFVKGPWISINGKRCDIGEAVPFGEGGKRSATLSVSEDTNNLILEVK